MLDAGGVIVEILAGSAGAQPSRTELDGWINTYRLPVTTLTDPMGAGTVTLRTYGIRESAFIVNLSTMRVEVKIPGSVLGVGDSAVRTAIPMMMTLLRGM